MTTACPACRHPGGRRAMTVGDFRLRRCGGCRSLWVEDPPSEEELAALYGDARYFAGRVSVRPGGEPVLGYRDYLADRRRIEAKFDRAVERVERHVGPGRLLDVGAGPGLLVSIAERRGWTARGVEPNPWAVAHGRERIGVDIRAGTLSSASFDGERFDAVTMMDLLEHLPAPAEAVARAARLTRPGGLLAVVTPDAGAAAARVAGTRWPEVQRVPGHLTLFSAAGLELLLERQGYEVVDRHSVGKTTTVETLVSDVAPAAPGAAALARRFAEHAALGRRTVTFDPRTKVCMYARLREGR